MMTRQKTLTHLRQNPTLSVLIIGAGINGAGTFRDLALQGVDVLIVDRGDFCSGASAASSHMIHGGVRYLENGEFRLVREAVQERNRFLHNAPHYVKPLPTTFPIFKWTSGLLNAPLKFMGWLDKPAERGAMVIKLGLSLYDAYTQGKTRLPRHQFFNREQSFQRHPQINPDIICTATYYDAAISAPERLCLEVILDGEAACAEAMALNYVSVVGSAGETITLRDEVTGDSLTVRPQVVINAAGPWIDLANQALGQETQLIGGTKGAHLVLDHPELRQAIGEQEFFFENDDGRIVLIYPLLDKVLVGTSDIAIDNPDEARCTEAEIDYFLGMVGRVFPTIEVNHAHIVFQYAGVRPLPSSKATTTGQISRDHHIQVIEPTSERSFPIYNLIGGKWTTFRAFSEQSTDLVLARMGRGRQTETKTRPIGGGQNYPHAETEQQAWLMNLAQQTELPLRRLQTLFKRYGIRAAEIARFIGADDTPLQHKPDYSRQEVDFLVRHEKVIHLDDFILRRSLLGVLGQVKAALIEELAEVIGQTLGWSIVKREGEVKRTLDILAERHGVKV